MKKLFSLFILLISTATNATVIYQRGVTMTQINAYDNIATIGAYIYLSENHTSCPRGAYLNPEAVNFNSLYSTVLSAFMAEKTVDFQMYDDRVESGRCEVNAVWVFVN